MSVISKSPPKLKRRFLRDRDWVSEYIQELIEKYPNQWILVHNREILFKNEELGPVWDKADELSVDQPYLTFIEKDIHVY